MAPDNNEYNPHQRRHQGQPLEISEEAAHALGSMAARFFRALVDGGVDELSARELTKAFIASGFANYKKG